MSRRSLLLLPAVVAAIALPVAPALAGEDDGDDSASATLRVAQGCASGKTFARATVTGNNIDTVAFYLDGRRISRVTQPNAAGSYSVAMRCSRLRVGAHRARAVVTFAEGSSPASRTLRYQITRSRQGSPQFTG